MNTVPIIYLPELLASKPLQSTVQCRICGADSAHVIGQAEYYAGYALPIADCATCGCRFTHHHATFYSLLHDEANSCYRRYRELAARCREHYVQRDLPRLRAELQQNAKYQFIIEEIEKLGPKLRILEVGCARGFLTAWALLSGHAALGSDISPEAIAAAREDFGEHFVLPDSAQIDSLAPYDVIYHVGTIGCVADPIKLTRELLARLKPGGKLLFNAPTRTALHLQGALWLDAAPPPDLVTLYPPGFWEVQFHHLATVQEHIASCERMQNVQIGLRKLFRRVWRPPLPLPIHASDREFAPVPRRRDALWRWFERGVCIIGARSGLDRYAPPQPADFGMLVCMTKKVSPP